MGLTIDCQQNCNSPLLGTCLDAECTVWEAGIRCCACNICPKVGTHYQENEKDMVVIQTNICPDAPFINTIGICDKDTLTCWTIMDIITELPDDLLSFIGQTIVDWLKNNVFNPGCPNVLEFMGETEFLGVKGNAMFMKICDGCRCAAVGTGF